MPLCVHVGNRGDSREQNDLRPRAAVLKRVLTAAQHKDLLVEMLVRSAGGESMRWRRLIGTVFILPLLRNPLCNWSVTPAGTPNEVAAIKVAVKLLRGAHPYARR